MIKILSSLVFLFMSCGLIGWISLVHSEMDKNRVVTEAEKISDTNLDEKMNLEFKEFYANQGVLCKSDSKKYENMMQNIHNYVQRYVSLFLITSNLLDHEIKDPDEEVTLSLEISVRGSDLAYLQGYSKSSKDSNYIRSLSKLDTIMSKIARQKERSYIEEGMRSSKSFFKNINISSVLTNPSFYGLLYFLILLFLHWTLIHYFPNKCFTLVLIGINSYILWEGLCLYWKRIKESDLEIYVKTKLMGDIPEECNPANHGIAIKWYYFIKNYFLESRCLQYYKTMAQKPADEVSLLRSIVDTYLIYFVNVPISWFGKSVNDLTEIFSASLFWPLRQVSYLPLAITFSVLLGFFILVLCGKRLRLSFFGAAIEVGDTKTVHSTEVIANSENLRGSRVIRKLKPWTKSRFPKRFNGDFGKQWKLKASKSSAVMAGQNVGLEQSNGANSLTY